jgi:hypothetical protein
MRIAGLPSWGEVGEAFFTLSKGGEYSMKTKRNLGLVVVSMAVIMSILACGGGGTPATATPAKAQPPTAEMATIAPPTEKPTTAPAKTQPSATKVVKPTAEAKPTEVSTTAGAGCDAVNDGDVGVAYVHGYKDTLDTWGVVGLVCNKTDKAVSNIEIEIDVLDKSGKSLLEKPESVNTTLYSLDAGEESPFYDWLVQDLPDADKVTAIVTGQDTADITRATIETQGIQTMVDDDGNIQITGELINKGKDPVEIHGLAAATFDKDNAMVTAGYGSVFIGYLAGCTDDTNCPAGPFRVTMYGPKDGSDVIDTYQVYYDVQTSDKQDFLISAKDDVSDVSEYFSADDSFHMAADVTNSSDKNVGVRLLVTLYDKDGNVVDASYADTPISAIQPGEKMPFEFSSWGPVVHKKGTYDVYDTWKIQVDPSWTWSTDTELVDLSQSVSDETQDVGDSDVTFKGTVTNDSGGELSSVIVVVGIYGKAGTSDAGKLLATSYGYADFSGNLAKGKTADYTVYVSIPQDFAKDNYEYDTLIKGRTP